MTQVFLETLLLMLGVPGLETSGYLKNLHQESRSQITRQRTNLNLTRARLGLHADIGFGKTPNAFEPTRRGMQWDIQYDHELRLGSHLRSRDFALAGLAEPPPHFSMSQTISSGTSGHYRHRLYRGWVEYREGPARLRFGRQRIAWGTGKMWNAVDFLNPYNVTSLERDERRGVDALYARGPLGALGQAEVVYTFARRWAQSDVLGRVKRNLWGADVSLLGGKVSASSSSWTVGGDLSVDLWGGDLHAEWLRTDLTVRPAFFKSLIGYEYSFSKAARWAVLREVWLVAEYFHNGIGARTPGAYNLAALASGREVTLARDYFGAGFTKQLHPLVKLESYHVLNLSDRSHFVSPAVVWNAVGDLHVKGGWQRFGGTDASEYGRLPNVLFFQAQYYF